MKRFAHFDWNEARTQENKTVGFRFSQAWLNVFDWLGSFKGITRAAQIKDSTLHWTKLRMSLMGEWNEELEQFYRFSATPGPNKMVEEILQTMGHDWRSGEKWQRPSGGN